MVASLIKEKRRDVPGVYQVMGKDTIPRGRFASPGRKRRGTNKQTARWMVGSVVALFFFFTSGVAQIVKGGEFSSLMVMDARRGIMQASMCGWKRRRCHFGITFFFRCFVQLWMAGTTRGWETSLLSRSCIVTGMAVRWYSCFFAVHVGAEIRAMDGPELSCRCNAWGECVSDGGMGWMRYLSKSSG